MFGEILQEMGFEVHSHHACVYTKKVEDTMVMMCCHVDDLLIAGRRSHVEEIFAELKHRVDVTYAEVEGSTTYLGRRLEVKKDEIIFGVEPKYVDNILQELRLRDLKGANELKWEI